MVDHLFADSDLAALYDLFCPREEREDLRFYLPIVMEASSVLDVGCGTGFGPMPMRSRPSRLSAHMPVSVATNRASRGHLRRFFILASCS